jgi:hypothetical protein
VSSITASGLTFTKRTSNGGSGSTAPLNQMELWWAVAPSALTAEVITVSWASTYDDAAILAFGVNGCYTASPWDSNASLPSKKLHAPSAAWTPSFTGISTTNANDFAIFACGNASAWTSLGTVPTGYTALGYVSNSGGTNFAQLGAAYEGLSSTLNNATITWGSTQGNAQSGAALFDVLTSGAPPIVVSGKSPIAAWDQRQLVADPVVLRSTRARLTPILVPPPVGVLADIATTSDALTVNKGQIVTLGDNIGSSDSYTILGNFYAALSDNTAISEVWSVESSSTVRLKAAGLVRKTLALYVPGVNTGGVIPTFPSLPEGFPIKVSPVLDTIIGTTKNLREMRVPQQTYAIWDIEIKFEQLKDQTQNQTPFAAFAGYTQFQALVGLWLSMYGQTGVFAFNCPWDNSRSEQSIGVGDGTTYQFPVFATYGLGAQATLVPVGLITSIQAVYVNGTLQAAGTYTFSRNRLLFINANGVALAPAAGATIALTFTFSYLCRWTEDEQDFEEYSKNRWTVPSLRFRASPWL